MATLIISSGFENGLGDFLGLTDVGTNHSYETAAARHGDYGSKTPNVDGNVIKFTGAAFSSVNPYISFWFTVANDWTALQSMRVVHDITAGVVLDVHLLRDAGGNFQVRFEYSDGNTGYVTVGNYAALSAAGAFHHLEIYGEGVGVKGGTAWSKFDGTTLGTFLPSAEGALTSLEFGRIDARNWGAGSFNYFDSFELWDGVPDASQLVFQDPPSLLGPGGQATGQRRSVLGPGSVGGL